MLIIGVLNSTLVYSIPIDKRGLIDVFIDLWHVVYVSTVFRQSASFFNVDNHAKYKYLMFKQNKIIWFNGIMIVLALFLPFPVITGTIDVNGGNYAFTFHHSHITKRQEMSVSLNIVSNKCHTHIAMLTLELNGDSTVTSHINTFEDLCQKQLSRAGTSNYLPQILWDVIICPRPWYLLLANMSSNMSTFVVNWHDDVIRLEIIYHKTSNISCTLVGNKIVDHSDEVGASPVGAAPTTSSFST